MTLISSSCKRIIVVGWHMKVLLIKYLGKSAIILWQTFAVCCVGSVRRQLINHSWHLCRADSSVILSCTYLRQWRWCRRKALTWILARQKETNLVERKGHFGYLQLDDNKNIGLHDRFFFYPTQTKANKAQSETVLDLFSGHNSTPYCVYTDFSYTHTFSAVILHK